MQIDDLKRAYIIVDKFVLYDTSSNPPRINTLDYKVPRVSGIHWGEYNKSIKEVKLNTLNYILYHLHDIDYTLIIETLIALLYYWKNRKRKLQKMQEAYQEIINHYTVKNKAYSNCNNFIKGSCIYLVKIYIGSKILYKVGISIDVNQRMVNLQSDIYTNYSFVSTGLELLQVVYSPNAEKLEETILEEMRSKTTKKHKFYFKGSTEAFESIKLIDIFKQYIL